MNNEQYIDHEVRLRVEKEINDEKFKQVYFRMDDRINKLTDAMNNRFKWLFIINGGILTSIIIPIILHISRLS